MKALIAGVTGFNGLHLARALKGAGHDVLGLARNKAYVQVDVPVVIGDAVEGVGLDDALANVDVAYYFIHSNDPGAGTPLDRDTRAARQFAAAAQRQDLRRIVYFTTFGPSGNAASSYREKGLVVESILSNAAPESVMIRCGVVLGSGSRSLRPFFRFVQRSLVLPLGRWSQRRMSTIDVQDVTRYLVAAGDAPLATAHCSFDLPAERLLTAESLLRAIADTLGLRRVFLRLPFELRSLTANLAALTTGESRSFMRELLSVTASEYVPQSERHPCFEAFPLRSLEASLSQYVHAWSDLPRYAMPST